MFGGMHICAWPVSVQCVHTTCACGVCVHTHIMHVHVECVRLCLCAHTGVSGGSWPPALSPFAFLTLCRDTLRSHSPGRTALRPYGKARGVNLGNPATLGWGQLSPGRTVLLFSPAGPAPASTWPAASLCLGWFISFIGDMKASHQLHLGQASQRTPGPFPSRPPAPASSEHRYEPGGEASASLHTTRHRTACQERGLRWPQLFTSLGH